MKKPGLIIGIDYTDKYCQACYFSYRHNRPESISTGEEALRYLFPTALCFNDETKSWVIGKNAIDYAENNKTILFKDLLENALNNEACYINEFEYSYTQLIAVYLGKLIEHIQIATSVMNIENITINMRDINHENKQVMLDAFEHLKISNSKVKLQTCSESYAYFVLNEKADFWHDGSLLFEFSESGFFQKELSVTKQNGDTYVYITENDCSEDFTMKNLGGYNGPGLMDSKFLLLYDNLISQGSVSSVFLTGQGFENIWFPNTLQEISNTTRVFRGNILYAKGACLAGFRRAYSDEEDYKIICEGRTTVNISTTVRHNGVEMLINLSKAAVDWFDAGSKTEFILDDTRTIVFYIRSLISRQRASVEFDLENFPKRPNKTTRVEVEIRYEGPTQCVIAVRDLGFGEFYPSSNNSVVKSINLEGYI